MAKMKSVTWKRARAPRFAATIAIGLLSTNAFAYRTAQDSPALADKGRIAWTSPSVAFYLSEAGLPEGLSKAQAEQAVRDSIATWAAVECSALQPTFAGWTDAVPAPKDGQNTIAWVSDWKARGYPKSAPGNTDMQYRGHDQSWQIAEADIYLNAADFDFSVDAADGTATAAVVTHELGHALGLLHPCEPGGEDGAPDCAGVSADVAETTMYPFYDPGQASLAEDDVAGLCYLYPAVGECPGGCGLNELCIGGECRALCGAAMCEVGERCGYWGCVVAGGCTEQYCVGQSCSGPDACGPLSSCVDGVCRAGSAAWGDACGASPDCAQGACVGGVCQPDCLNDGGCMPYGTCRDADDGQAKGCELSGKYETGMRCTAGEDCESRICMFSAKPSVCTTECKDGGSCLSNWSCQTVDDRKVCVPPSYQPSGGCSVAAPSPGDGNVAFRLLALFGLATGAAFGVRRFRARGY